MRVLISLAATVALLIASDAIAQQCGSSCGTSQCNLNSRPRSAEPAAVPRAAPASLPSVAIDDAWSAPAPERSTFKVASMRADEFDSYVPTQEIPVRQVGLNLGLVNVGNRQGDLDGLITAARSEMDQQRDRIARLEQQIIDARARGEEVTYDDVLRAVNAARYQPTADEAYQLMKSSPQFQRDLAELLNRSRGPEIVRWEIVPVE